MLLALTESEGILCPEPVDPAPHPPEPEPDPPEPVPEPEPDPEPPEPDEPEPEPPEPDEPDPEPPEPEPDEPDPEPDEPEPDEPDPEPPEPDPDEPEPDEPDPEPDPEVGAPAFMRLAEQAVRRKKERLKSPRRNCERWYFINSPTESASARADRSRRGVGVRLIRSICVRSIYVRPI